MQQYNHCYSRKGLWKYPHCSYLKIQSITISLTIFDSKRLSCEIFYCWTCFTVTSYLFNSSDCIKNIPLELHRSSDCSLRFFMNLGIVFYFILNS